LEGGDKDVKKELKKTTRFQVDLRKKNNSSFFSVEQKSLVKTYLNLEYYFLP